ncbi:MAG TPA: hypothetical protein VMJ11_20590 [Paraburkholderia sp.]|uniref:hypothetical protein n=1 Tax=Paraburkholderia sp. TaxID=1926495 RepID=UPI002CF0A228|nr:hypothetical protein [Paraburkholderia sp.]HTR09001.1 hypothetical protein [Paraburkholderia sp.]
MKRVQVFGLLCGALLAGCMSAGVEVSPDQMSHFRPGVTTLQQVVAALGPASVQTALDDGSTLLVYTYVTSRPHPENFIPFVGALVGGTDTHTSAAVFLFDTSGVLKSENTTTSNVGTGLSSGLSAEQHGAPAAPAAAAAEPPAVTRSVPSPTVQNVEPIPGQNLQLEFVTPGEPTPGQSVEPTPEE